MNRVAVMWQLPTDFELWLILAYVAGVLIGARIVEWLAQAHFARARRLGHQGFSYIKSHDHYYCVGGATLKLHEIHDSERLAVYRAPAFHCAICQYKQRCTPDAESREIHHSLATWAETDVGRFHQLVSVLMFLVAGVLSSAALWQWRGQPGFGYSCLGLVGSIACIGLHGRRLIGGQAPTSTFRESKVSNLGAANLHVDPSSSPSPQP